MERVEFLNCPVDLATMDDTVSLIEERISARSFTQHVVVNVAKIINMRKDAVLSASVKNCDIINVDGMGVVWGARFLGMCVPERVTGIDLFYRLLDMSTRKGFSIYLLGARKEVVVSVVDEIRKLYPGIEISGFHHGYFWNDEAALVKNIHASGADMLFVAITSPKKEKFINRWQNQLGVKFVMGVGGTFDVVAGRVRRAPVWMQKAGLEWLYRLIREPCRLWRRYLLTNMQFAWLLLRERFKRLRVR